MNVDDATAATKMTRDLKIGIEAGANLAPNLLLDPGQDHLTGSYTESAIARTRLDVVRGVLR
jgi:hypothetical protein